MSQRSNPSFVKKILREKGVSIKKRFGQNFLVDRNLVEKIVAAADIGPDKWALEIGPGLGVLTAELGKNADQVIALEIDNELVAILQENLAMPNVHIVSGDALQQDWGAILEQKGWNGQPISLAANLPYYLTTPLIMKALECDIQFSAVVVMVQKEVAQRMVAQPGGKDYGVLTLAVQYYTDASIVANVPRTVFIPAPDVDSAIVKMTPHPPSVTVPHDKLFSVIRSAFQQRRKTIRNALRSVANEWGINGEQYDEAFQLAGIDPSVRGERLSLQEFSDLTNSLIQMG